MSINKLIPVINKLQDIFTAVGIKNDLPQMVVVGEQSAGKSSVLENIIGHEILPRGNNIVTRRPLIIQLYPTKSSQMRAEMLDPLLEKRKIAYKKKFTNYEEIKKAIKFVTDKGAPGQKIVDSPIRLRIHSNEVIELTLVDTPGITKIPVGNQDEDVEKVTKALVRKFIKRPNCVILAVSAANQDVANSEALKMAREVDYKGERTVGILTKIDIMDEGTDCMDVLTGKKFPLKLGYVGVVNRSQLDINNKKKIKDALAAEKRYFGSHPIYKTICSKQGIPYLSSKLNKVLLKHIRLTLPDLRNKIDHLITQARDRLIKYGPPIDEGEGVKGTLLQFITKFVNDFRDMIDGKNVDETNELFGGARINWIFYKKYLPILSALEPKNLSDHDIKLRIEVAKGTKPTLYLPENAFHGMVKMQVKRLLEPSIRCCDQVFTELVLMCDHCLRQFYRFPTLKDQIRKFTLDLLQKYIKPLKEYIKNIINCEMSFVNTNHPDFFEGGSQIFNLLDKLNEPPPPPRSLQQKREEFSPPKKKSTISPESTPLGFDDNKKKRSSLFENKREIRSKKRSKIDDEDFYKRSSVKKPEIRHSLPQPKKIKKIDREKMEVEVLRTLLSEYFVIVKKQIGDSVPKSIMHFLVNMSCDNLHPELIKSVYTLDPSDLLKEAEDIKKKRKTTKKMLEVLLQAQEILNELNEVDVS